MGESDDIDVGAIARAAGVMQSLYRVLAGVRHQASS